ncbi:MAG: CoA transferase [Spirochaetes bacterium]|nr:CoA transferase [Spirochaetota bacterium]
MNGQTEAGVITDPLSGITILDLSTQVPGPYCSMLLGDLGADVIKIEQPGIGDSARLLPFLFNGINRNKKSMVLDLKSPEGKKIFRELAARADVVLEGFRPGVTENLGIDYEALQNLNPGIIYCSITGYGQNGPYRENSGHDVNYLGISGLLSLAGESANSCRIPELPVADLAGSMFAALSILSALIQREKTAAGQYIDVSMTAAVFSWLSASLGAGLNNANAGPPVFLPHYGVFKTKDGRSLTLGIVHEEHFWKNLCTVINLGDMSQLKLLDRIVKREELHAALQSAFLLKNRDEWIALLSEADVPCGPVLSVNESWDDPQIRHRDLVFDMNHAVHGKIRQRGFPALFSGIRLRRDLSPPSLGEHSDAILADLGYSREQIQDLLNKGVISSRIK